MKIQTNTQQELTVTKNNIIGILIGALVAVTALVFGWAETVLMIIAGIILIALLFVPYKETITADKQQQKLIVNKTGLFRKKKREAPFSEITQLVISLQTRHRSDGKTRNTVRFYAELDKGDGQYENFFLPSPSVSSFGVQGFSVSKKINDYDILEEIAEAIGVPLNRQTPMNAMDAIKEFQGRMQD